MSEGDSPHGALSDSETNNSIIHKVRSRVSSIIPNSFSKWFSPTTKSDGKNGSNRRRREISEEQDSSNEDEEEEGTGSEPPVKRTKCDSIEERSTSLFEDPFSPSTSRIHDRNNSTRSTFETRTSTVTATSKARNLSSTPSASLLLNRNRRYLGLNKNVASTPYDFNSKKSNELPNFEVHQLNNNNYSNNDLDHYSRGLDVRKRMKLDTIGGRSSNTSSNNIYERSVLNSSSGEMFRKHNKSFNINNNNLDDLAGSEIYADDLDQDEVDELTLPIEEEDGEGKFNGMHGTPSESEGSICSFTERPGSSADMNLNDDGKRIHRNRMSLKSTKTGINFSSHLQSEKSLFSDKNLSSSLTNSSMSLNSWNRRPSFNASLYGSTSALSDSRLLNVKSPFYDGQTIYGGASTYAKNISRMQKALRVPVQIRPVSSLSTTSSSNTSNTNPVLSNTAKRILDLMNQFNDSSPLNDAKKMGNTLSSRVPPLSLARQNYVVEDELNLNRSIRLNSAKSPYSRYDNKVTRPVNKSLTTELQIPSVSHLLQIKRLQKKTEELRQLANDSKSILNTNKTTTEYKLPANDNKDSESLNNNSNKHTNKIKNKISVARPDKKQTNDDEPPTPLNLPNISFPAMKSVPQFDISLPTNTKSDSNRQSGNNFISTTAKMSKINSNATTTPKLGNDSSSSNLMRVENFKFESLLNKSSPMPTSLSNNINKKSNATNVEFSFSEPIPVSETIKVDSVANSVDINFEFRKPITIKNSNGSTKVDNNSLSTSDKKISTPTAMSTFKFSENLDKNKSINSLSFTVPKPKETAQSPKMSSEVSKPSVELKSGSVIDLLMKYKNETIKADDAKKEKSVITPPNKEDKPLVDIFKPKTGTWECDVCMIRNDSNLTKCIACETPKPGAQNNISSSNSIPLNALQPLTAAVPVKDDLFKKLVEKQNEKWECTTCNTRNESSRNKCICCEQAKPGAENSQPQFSFGSVEPKFSFGVPADAPVSTTTTTPESNAIPAAATSFTFGITPTTTVSSATAPSFTFGIGANSTPSQTAKSVAPAVIPSGFKFGYVKPTDKVDAPKLMNNDNKSDEVKEKPANSSIFGSPAGSSSVALASNTTPKPVPPPVTIESKSTVSDTSKKNESTSSFIFGIQNSIKPTESPLVKPTISEHSITPTCTTSTTSSSTSSVGGFKFTPPSNPSPSTSTGNSTNNETKILNTTPTASAASTAVPGQQVSPFGAQTSGFSLFKKPETTSPLAITPLVTKNETKTAIPTFGSIPQANKIESPVAPQQTITEAKPPPTASFVFGTPTNSTAPKTENIFGSGTINPAPPVTSSTFGNTSDFGFSTATTTNSSITSPFSGFGTNTSSPTIGFGTKINQTSTPTFGSFGGGNSTNQTATTTNNTNTHTVTPVFGSFGAATEPSSTLDTSINNTPFGQPAKIFGVNNGGAGETSTAAGGFGSTSGNIFGQNTTSATFGSQLPTQSNFGSQSITPLSTFGATTTPAATPFNPPPPQQNDTAPSAKNVFQFRGVQQTNEQQPPPSSSNLFQFGAANNSNNSAPKATFNFSTTTPPSFNFTATASTTNSAQPFTFGAAEPQQTQVASGGFNFGASSTEVASNSPFQFGATPPANPFAATPAGLPRRKVKPARRLR